MARLIFSVYAIALALLQQSCSDRSKAQENDGSIDSTSTDRYPSEETRTAITAFTQVSPKTKSQINDFLTDYFALNQALVHDQQETARVAAQRLLDRIKRFELAELTGGQMDFYYIQISKLNMGLEGIVDSADIEKSRTGLAVASEGMFALAKAFHPNDSPLYWQYCPMARHYKGARWLSNTKDIVNPYMGQIMPACGRTEDILQ